MFTISAIINPSLKKITIMLVVVMVGEGECAKKSTD